MAENMELMIRLLVSLLARCETNSDRGFLNFRLE
jgi:hypothetical protein